MLSEYLLYIDAHSWQCGRGFSTLEDISKFERIVERLRSRIRKNTTIKNIYIKNPRWVELQKEKA